MPSWQHRPSAVCILAIGGLFVVAFLILEHSPVGKEVNGDLLGFMKQGVVVLSGWYWRRNMNPMC